MNPTGIGGREGGSTEFYLNGPGMYQEPITLACAHLVLRPL